MALKIGGVDPTKIMVGSAPASKIMSGGEVVWSAVRKVTITATDKFTPGSETGDTDLIQSQSGGGVIFVVDVTCDRDTRIWFGASVPAGGICPAGSRIMIPTSGSTSGTYIFTEVLP